MFRWSLLAVSTAIFGLALALALPTAPVAADPVPMPGAAKVVKKGPRGHKPAPAHVAAKRHADAFARHGDKMKALPRVSAASFDCRQMGWVLPVNDQGQCGDCFGVSTIDGCAMSFVKAGRLPNAESSRWSGQYGLDCGGFQGDCNGGDEAQVFEYAKTNGFPLTSSYGPYTAGVGRCKTVDPAKLLKIADYGYCTPSQEQGVASTDDIKTAMAAHGPISVAFDASECDSYTWPQTMCGTGTGVDHAVLCIGWDDAHDNGDGTKGAFLGLNQWGASWGDKGVFWIKYGADSWGTEAIWVTAGPGPTPPPIPPGPPVPPVPPTPPLPTTVWSGTITVTNGLITDVVPASAPTTLEGVLTAVLADPRVQAALAAKGLKAEALPSGMLVKIMVAIIGVVTSDLAAGKTFAQMMPDIVAAVLKVITGG